MKKHVLFLSFLLACSGILMLNSCKKDNSTAETDGDNSAAKVLTDFPAFIAEANLNDLQQKAAAFNGAAEAFLAAPSQQGLTAMQQQWYETRTAWEQSEAFLFGPVATLELDPSIDSWPVNFVDIDSVISNNSTFPDSYIDSLNPTLKGFHPIEYLIFGQNGNRQYTELSARQKDYLAALSKHLQRTTARMYHEWSATGGNFGAQLTQAGSSASQYASRKDALLEIVDAMAGIVEEVGTGKIEEPFASKDPSLEESPFARNSFRDFRNNLRGVQNVYTGKYTMQGSGIQLIVQQYNKSLDLKIQQKVQQCIDNLGAYQVSFGDAINSQPGAIQSTQAMLADLQQVLEEELRPLIQQNIK